MTSVFPRACRSRQAATLLLAVIALALEAPAAIAAPPIRSSSDNRVPACVTPDRLMAFLGQRNASLDPRFRNIAQWYKHYGDAWRVRWDYAFFQMTLETNFLKFRRGNGKRGDVSEAQNNFAGIGATGGGVRGERFADVATGVHAQIQHLVAYSGERLAAPIATRTRERQGDIIEVSLRLGRPVTFADLARRWAVDRAYGKSIDFIAGLYQAEYCAGSAGRSAQDVVPPPPQPARRGQLAPFPPPSGLGGPKPQGPEASTEAAPANGEQLPWLTPQKEQAAESAAPKAAKKRSSKKKQPAKSTVSRGRAGTTAKANAATQPAPAAKTPEAAAAEAPPPASVIPPAAEHHDGTKAETPETPTATARADQSPALLPTFKIAPAGNTPSRLGGPLPPDPSATTTAPSDQSAPPCRVLSASYGGSKTLLVRSTSNGETRYIALTVLDGFEKSMFETYSKAQGPGAEIVGEYQSQDAALADAHVNCPGD